MVDNGSGYSVVDVRLFVVVVVLRHSNSISVLFHGGDVMYEMTRKKPEATHLPTEGIFNLPNHIGIV